MNKYILYLPLLLLGSCSNNNNAATQTITTDTPAAAKTQLRQDTIKAYTDTTRIVMDSAGLFYINSNKITSSLDSSLAAEWDTIYNTFNKLPVYFTVTYKGEALMGIRGDVHDEISMAQQAVINYIKRKDSTGNKTAFSILYQKF